jgi:hypothetical protein
MANNRIFSPRFMKKKPKFLGNGLFYALPLFFVMRVMMKKKIAFSQNLTTKFTGKP